jgi:hypothetical protein
MPWQEEHGYPLMFASEASIDLCRGCGADAALMVDANISNVFVGIESPNEQSVPTIRHNPRHCVCREMGRRSLSEHLGFGRRTLPRPFLVFAAQPTHVCVVDSVGFGLPFSRSYGASNPLSVPYRSLTDARLWAPLSSF